MAWVMFLAGAGLLTWGLAGLRAQGRRLGAAEERMAHLATELATAGEAVLQAADARLTELEEAVSAADRRLAALASLAAPAVPAVPAAAPIPTGAGKPLPGPAGDETAAALTEAEAPATHRTVWRLADAGWDEVAIGRETGLLAGEVRLILGLRRLQRRR